MLTNKNSDQKRSKVGVVLSSKMEKTVVVRVERSFPHPQYGKVITRDKKYYAHTDKKIAEGQRVRIVETRPLSKTKRWRVVDVLTQEIQEKI